ncbi:FkbM family methyltransferase [Kiritimatiellota bacterium B12222]|nr:FkbM family methyltransferase [Kiritimatiellota bacterium B12222]
MASKFLQILLQFPTYRKHLIQQGEVAKYVEGKGYLPASLEQEIAPLLTFLPPESVNFCIDAGANKGRYSEQLLHFFPHADILAVEPSPVNCEALHQKFKDQPKVSILEAALCSENGPVTFYSDQPGSSKASLTQRDLRSFNIKCDHLSTVLGRNFDDYWETELNQKPIDLFKMDVEGHELEVLKSSLKALQSTRVVQFEFGGCNIDTRTFLRDFWNFFTEQDFSLFRITPFGLHSLQKYHEKEEHFQSSNFIAINTRIQKEFRV